MHMADALLAPSVAATMYAVSGITTGLSVAKLNKEDSPTKLPVMGVMSAFVFAGQMINYTIPGTGSSGHICGGMMLSAMLGPQAGFISMAVILLIQCLFFADGGLMAYGANVWNMAFYGCFIGYYLIYRPIMNSRIKNSRVKISLASILGCVITLELGAFSVCMETLASGITELPFGAFTGLMLPIHLAIGLVEGIITAAVLIFVYETRPELLSGLAEDNSHAKMTTRKLLIILSVTVILVAGVFSQFASSNPDGLEWSLFGNEEEGYNANMGLDEENFGINSSLAEATSAVQEKTAFLPDYAFINDSKNTAGTSVSGIIGSVIVAGAAMLICFVSGLIRKKKQIINE